MTVEHCGCEYIHCTACKIEKLTLALDAANHQVSVWREYADFLKVKVGNLELKAVTDEATKALCVCGSGEPGGRAGAGWAARCPHCGYSGNATWFCFWPIPN